MRKYKEPTDKKNPYRNLGLGMVKAPSPSKSDIKSSRISANDDMRVKRGN